MEPYVIQNDGSYALTLEFASGIVSPPILETVKQIVDSEGARLHLTISQKLMLLDLSKEAARKATEQLKAAGANFKFPKQVYQPRVCVGSRYCKLGLKDTISFGDQIYEKYSDLDIPYKIKIGVSGCRASCAHSTLADIGFIGRKSGYKIFVGGKSGIDPTFGKSLPGLFSEKKALQILGKAIEIYCEHADQEKQFQRLSHVIEKLGFEKFQAMVTDTEGGPHYQDHIFEN
ncbi:MAG: hypothetical protein R6U13_06380 [Desulfatiglandaceae bacterium]